MRLIFYERLEPLVEDDDTNWFLNNASDVYHFACLSASANLIGDTERSMKWLGQYKQSVDQVNVTDQRSRRTSRFAPIFSDRTVV